ncbi:MAG: hypothetical protein HQ579_02575 [Candidatus Omnitrophica bacterium]|nr:hypothetical protein [Candidatus Omnitrophota bacterium]
MKKKATQKIKPTPEYDSERETRVLLEEVGSDVKKIAEQVGSNSLELMKLGKMEKDIVEVKSELGTVKIAVMENSRGIRGNSAGIQENSNRLDRIEKKLDTVTTDLEKRVGKLEVVR